MLTGAHVAKHRNKSRLVLRGIAFVVELSSPYISDNSLREKLLILFKSLLQEAIAYHSMEHLPAPGHTLFAESCGKLFAYCWLW